MNPVLLDLTLRGSLAFLIVWAVDALLASRMQAKWRRAWWLLVPVVFLLPWKAAVVPVEAASPVDVLSPIFFPTIPAHPTMDFPPGHITSQPFVSTVWLVWFIGAVGSVGVLVVRTIRASRRWAGLRFSTDARLLGILEDCKARAEVHAPIGLVVAREVDAPVIAGWLRPRILLPASFATSANEERLRHVILHELAHFRFMDVPAGWLFALARCVHWFNPFAHLAAARWSSFREEAADEAAIRWSGQADSMGYGETLLSFVRDEPAEPSMGVLAIGETFSNLKHRISMITHYAQRNPKIVLALVFSLAVAALATLQAQAPAESATPAADPSTTAKAVAVAAMEKWLGIIDEGKYAPSWDDAAASFQKALTSDQWVAALTSVRSPLGALESRKLASALLQKGIPKPNGQMLEGEFVIAQFDTSFANMKYAIETVTFEKQGDAWKAAGYFIKPR
jgi:beta-lactamase regulating signal transducer with metallopeptidase domain